MVPPLHPPTATRPLAVRHNLFTSAETLQQSSCRPGDLAASSGGFLRGRCWMVSAECSGPCFSWRWGHVSQHNLARYEWFEWCATSIRTPIIERPRPEGVFVPNQPCVLSDKISAPALLHSCRESATARARVAVAQSSGCRWLKIPKFPLDSAPQFFAACDYAAADILRPRPRGGSGTTRNGGRGARIRVRRGVLCRPRDLVVLRSRCGAREPIFFATITETSSAMSRVSLPDLEKSAARPASVRAISSTDFSYGRKKYAPHWIHVVLEGSQRV
jgi:hypothetical protein